MTLRPSGDGSLRTFLYAFAIVATSAAFGGTVGTESYTYDALGRLSNVNWPDGTKTVYGYDAAGNRVCAGANASPDATAPTTPTSLSGTSTTGSQVNLTWSASTDTGGAGLAGYYIYRGGVRIGASATTSYSDNTTSAGVSYSYRVAAYDKSCPPNVSAQSAALAVTAGPNVSDNATLVQGILNSGGGTTRITQKGYINGSPPKGSYTPSTLTGGKAVASFYDVTVCSANPIPASCPAPPPAITQSANASVTISGFTVEPGPNWLVSATAMGVTRTGSSASYSYSSGAALWTWSGTGNQFGFSGSGSTSTTIVHK